MTQAPYHDKPYAKPFIIDTLSQGIRGHHLLVEILLHIPAVHKATCLGMCLTILPFHNQYEQMEVTNVAWQLRVIKI